MSFVDALPQRYRVILCDIWGVVHDGVTLYPGAADRLVRWRGEGRFVVLITNAPRTAEAVEQQLERIGLPGDAWDAISTSGEAGIAALKLLGTSVGFLGTRSDWQVLTGRGIMLAEGNDFTDLACTGLDEQRSNVNDYITDLERWAERSVRMHCLNPDRLVIRGGVPEACAGAIADVYEALGGQVKWYGKPHKAIYDHSLHLSGDPSPDQVLAVGDGLQTDILGAALMGFDAVFVTGGIHAGEPFPEEFAAKYSLGEWAPVAVVDSLA